jgi:hypothetical protein
MKGYLKAFQAMRSIPDIDDRQRLAQRFSTSIKARERWSLSLSSQFFLECYL